MTSEPLTTTSIDIVRSPETSNTARFLRLRKSLGALSMAAATFASTALPLVESVRTEVDRYQNMDVGNEAPFVIQPEACVGETNINAGLDDPAIAAKNRAYELKYGDEKSSAKLAPAPKATEEDASWLEDVSVEVENAADWSAERVLQARGLLELHKDVVLHEQFHYISKLTGMEVAVSGRGRIDLEPAKMEALMATILNPNNYEHSQLSQLMACVHEKLVKEKIHRGNRLHIVMGEAGMTFKDYRFQPGVAMKGIAMPTNLVPAPDIIKSEVMIAIAPGIGTDAELNLMLAHELQHSFLHLIDHPIRLDPNEKQAAFAAAEVAWPYLKVNGPVFRLERHSED